MPNSLPSRRRLPETVPGRRTPSAHERAWGSAHASNLYTFGNERFEVYACNSCKRRGGYAPTGCRVGQHERHFMCGSAEVLVQDGEEACTSESTFNVISSKMTRPRACRTDGVARDLRVAGWRGITIGKGMKNEAVTIRWVRFDLSGRASRRNCQWHRRAGRAKAGALGARGQRVRNTAPEF